MIYAILKPDQELPLGYLFSESPPSLEALADALATQLSMPDRDALLNAYPGLLLGWAILH